MLIQWVLSVREKGSQGDSKDLGPGMPLTGMEKASEGAGSGGKGST